MINLGKRAQEEHWPDNWTATTMDGSFSAQFEETLLYCIFHVLLYDFSPRLQDHGIRRRSPDGRKTKKLLDLARLLLLNLFYHGCILFDFYAVNLPHPISVLSYMGCTLKVQT